MNQGQNQAKEGVGQIDDTINYLRDKMEMDRQIKERELQIAEQRENTMQQILAQQQQQNQAILALMLSTNTRNQSSS